MLLAILSLVIGLIFLVYSADYLVKGASNLASAVGISPLVVGLTVVAFGTSAPELAVSVMSAVKGQAEIAVGNVVGSNIFNVLFILGISAMIIPLVVNAQLVRFDVPIMIACSVLLYLLSLDGSLSKIDGIILSTLLLIYVFLLLRISKKEKDANVLTEFDKEYASKSSEPQWLKNIAFVVFGVIGLVIGSDRLVYGAVFIAKQFGVSELIIGLTIIAAGTSLPEVATSIMAAIKGERDIAVGNVVGSNIFNILTVLGLSALVSPGNIPIPEVALNRDIIYMIAIAVATLPVFFHGYKIGRISGFLFLAFYVIYVVYLILDAQKNPSAETLLQVSIYYISPVVGLALLILLVRAFRQGKNLA